MVETKRLKSRPDLLLVEGTVPVLEESYDPRRSRRWRKERVDGGHMAVVVVVVVVVVVASIRGWGGDHCIDVGVCIGICASVERRVASGL